MRSRKSGFGQDERAESLDDAPHRRRSSELARNASEDTGHRGSEQARTCKDNSSCGSREGYFERRIPRPSAPSPRPSALAQRGYTLIEVIVAFGVLALALTLLLGSLSGATRQVRDADLAGRAALHAQSLLDQVGVGEVLEPGTRDGEFERGLYRWTLNVSPYRDAARAAQPEAVAQPELMQLLLTVQWGDDPRRERLQLRTLRLVAPDAVAGMGAVP